MIAKILNITDLGSSKRSYNLWNHAGTLSFEGVEYQGTDSDIAFSKAGQIAYSLQETGKSLRIDIITDDATFIDDVGYGSALSEGVLSLLYYDSTWQRCPVRFRGMISRVKLDTKLVTFNLDSGNVDGDRIYPKIWSHQSQLREYPNDQGFRFLPILIKEPTRNFLTAIGDR